MVSDLTAIYLQCKVALDFIDKHFDIVDGAIAEMATFVPEFMDECCDASDALDLLRDNMNILREKIDEELSKLADWYNPLNIKFNEKNDDKETEENERP